MRRLIALALELCALVAIVLAASLSLIAPSVGVPPEE